MSTPQKITLHFIQDIPTPHNNVLLKALQNDPAIDLRIWYARLTHPQYSFKAHLAYEVGVPIIYGHRLPSWQLIKTALTTRCERFFIVGWMNPTTRLLVLLFWLLRRPYNMWFDLPSRRLSSWPTTFARKLYYFMLKTSKAKVFCVGKETIQYFKEKGFPNHRLVNLPIIVAVDKPVEEYRKHRDEIRAKYGVTENDLFITSGSRLIREKGFDLLIQAIAMLNDATKAIVKLLIVGKGPEKVALVKQAETLGLAGQVFFEDWMDNDIFMDHVGSCDVVVHPARYDAYGGTTLIAMVAGIPVIGSLHAGSARDRIENGKNGWLYESSDVTALAHLLYSACKDRQLLKLMGAAARQTAENSNPTVTVNQVVNQII